MDQQELEQKMQYAERVLEKLGAVPQEINQKNREILGQRVTYLLGTNYYRIACEEFDGKPYLILNAIDNEKYADIGLMEDVQAISADASEETIRRRIYAAIDDN